MSSGKPRAKLPESSLVTLRELAEKARWGERLTDLDAEDLNNIITHAEAPNGR